MLLPAAVPDEDEIKCSSSLNHATLVPASREETGSITRQRELAPIQHPRSAIALHTSALQNNSVTISPSQEVGFCRSQRT